jgi:hypothetical protein
VPVELEVHRCRRLPEPVEVAAYYVVSEALTNVVKHARASLVRVVLQVRDEILELVIRDDGAGGADPSRGSGLIGLRDRVDAIGGTIVVESRQSEIGRRAPVNDREVSRRRQRQARGPGGRGSRGRVFRSFEHYRRRQADPVVACSRIRPGMRQRVGRVVGMCSAVSTRAEARSVPVAAYRGR